MDISLCDFHLPIPAYTTITTTTTTTSTVTLLYCCEELISCVTTIGCNFKVSHCHDVLNCTSYTILKNAHKLAPLVHYQTDLNRTFTWLPHSDLHSTKNITQTRVVCFPKICYFASLHNPILTGTSTDRARERGASPNARTAMAVRGQCTNARAHTRLWPQPWRLVR
jgi:hypothetical protein